jgi:hypothetical protein
MNRMMEHFLNRKTTQTILNQNITNDMSQYQIARKLEIPRVKNISNQELRKKYINKGIPVILEGYANKWECVKKWNPDFLIDNYGEDKVPLMGSPEDMNNIDYSLEYVTLKDVVESMVSGDTSRYSRFNRILYNHPELLKDFDYKWLLKMRNFFSSGKTLQVFLGAKGTKTHLHAASEHNLFTQVYGEKHWYIYAPNMDPALKPLVTGAPYFITSYDPENPDFENYPAMRYVDRYECVLKAGDVFFNPPSYWHHVTNLTPSIGVGFRWFGVIDCFRLNFSQALLTIFAKNPPIWFAARYRDDFTKIFNYMKKKQRLSHL